MLKALASGFIGACVLSLTNETVRQFSERAPRLDLLGGQAVENTFQTFGEEPPDENSVYAISLTGDLASNAVYYSLVAAAGAKNSVLAGAVLGAAAGLGTVYLPPAFGIKRKYSASTFERAAMTVGYYTLGGLAAGLVYSLMAGNDD